MSLELPKRCSSKLCEGKEKDFNGVTQLLVSRSHAVKKESLLGISLEMKPLQD